MLVKRDLETLLAYLKQSRAFDFTAYKRSTLGRRVLKRMQAVDVEDFGDYVDYLEVHPDEFSHLFNTILINVTSFFRDPMTWEWLKEYGIPRLAANKTNGDPIRIWSAGCASGEEPYSLAILLADALGVDRFKEQVKIYATDVDDEALAQGRHASYTERQVAGVPESALSRYFDRINGHYIFNKELRRSVIFGRNDLIQDAPISRVSLLVCRNTLMYFNSEAQSRILERFHFAVEDTGLLFLGKAEMLLARGGMFAPTDLKARIFEKVPRGPRRERAPAEPEHEAEQNRAQPMNPQSRSEIVALESHQELETAYEQLQSTNEELETTKEALQSAVEELESTTEELQSTNEELETMNEELQSINEELSTANDQRRQRGNELNHLNSVLESILTSLHQVVVVVDKDLRIQGWNRKAEDLWGLRADEVQGQPFLNLDIGLEVDRLRVSIRAALAGERDVQPLTLKVDAMNRHGRSVDLTIKCTPLGTDRDVRGVILMMDASDDGGKRQEG